MRRALAFLFSTLALAAPPTQAAETVPRRIEVARGAALMFYNAPLALWSERARAVFVAFAAADGAVRVARVDPVDGRVAATGAVHLYGEPDDHAPPALHEIAEGPHAGKLLAITAHHSSELRVYRSRAPGAVDRFEEVCRRDGIYTYPRIEEEAGGALTVLLRKETPKAQSDAEGKGHHTGRLIALALDPQTGACGEERELAAPPMAAGVVYAAAPMAGWRDDPFVVWSNLDYADFVSRDLMLTDLAAGASRNLHASLPEADAKRQVLAWSSATIGGERFVSYVAFKERTRCCLLGSSSLVLFRAADGAKKPVLRLDDRPMPYYPTGITLNADGRTEALVPDIAPTGSTLTRRSIARGNPGAALPSCPVSGVPAMAQYVRGLGGAYVWAEFEKTYGQNDFDATVFLCLVDQAGPSGE